MTARKKNKAKPRGRPQRSEEEIAETRAKIADAARALFQAEGYAEISMRRLAAELACSPMTIYQYYPDGKVGILRAIWADIFAALFGDLDVIAAKKQTDAERLERLCARYVAYWLSHPDHYRVVFMAEGVTQSEVSIFIDETAAAAQFQLFWDALSSAARVRRTHRHFKAHADLLVAALNGVAHCAITMSGYAWADPQAMARLAGRSVCTALAAASAASETRERRDAE